MPNYKVSKLNPMTVLVEVELTKGETHFDIFNAPDMHWDNPKCQRELLKSHLDEVKKSNGVIVMPGDTFCLMQGKYDPRGNKADIRPEHNVSNYLDAIVDDAAEWFKPYRENIVCIGTGNHESSILKRCETNILERFAGALGGNVPVLGYHGWIVFRISSQGAQRGVWKYYFNHGSGGGGPVTRGQIEFSRFMMSIEGADCISAGHIHEKNASEVMVHYFDDNPASYKPKIKPLLLMRSSTYKQEYTKNGFHIERGAPPKPLGGTYVRIHLKRDKNKSTITAEPRFTPTNPIEIC